MAEIKSDNNQIAVMAGVLNTDGDTPTMVKINPSTHVLDTSDGTSGSDLGDDIIARDNSGETVMAATDANGNIINLYVNSSGQLLIKSS